MHTPIDLGSLPDELTLPVVAGFPPLLPLVGFPPAVERPQSLAALEAGREGGLVAWMVTRDPSLDATPDNLLAIATVCQVGQGFPDDRGRTRTMLHPVARCTWSDRVDVDGGYATARFRPVGLDAVRDPGLEPLAAGLILQALLGEDDDLHTLLATATKDVGALADEALFHMLLSAPPDAAMLDLYEDIDPRLRFDRVCALLEVEPVVLPDPPALVAARARASAMLAGHEPPDVAALMEDFFPHVVEDDGTVPLEMVLALGRVLALASGGGT